MASESVRSGLHAAASVAVITRTRNRPLLLTRAGRSVARQSYRDLLWVVVNDGGDEGEARAAAEASGIAAQRLLVVSHRDNIGMEAAANSGAHASRSIYLAVHDDDDTWHPEFLARCVDFLESGRGRPYAGAVTHADYVSEDIRGGDVVEHRRAPYNAELASVQLAEMLVRNLFPPISFVFRRDVWERAGTFNERLPVLGDWYFNIRFLLEADIAVIPERLANWHHRDRGGDGQYANSVVGGRGLHEEYNAIVRNALVRDLAGSPSALAPVLGYMMEQQRLEGARLRRSLGGASAASVAATAGPADPAAQLAAVADIADRRWVAAQLPAHARLRLRKVADPGWPDLVPFVRSARLRTPGDFDEESYLAANPDVHRAIQSGKAVSGFDHYVRFGRLEGRTRPLKLPR